MKVLLLITIVIVMFMSQEVDSKRKQKGKVVSGVTVEEEIKILSGDKVTLTCPGLDMLDSPDWYKNSHRLRGVILKKITERRVMLKEKDKVIDFDYVVPVDEGVYECILENDTLARYTLEVETIDSIFDTRDPRNCMLMGMVISFVVFAVGETAWAHLKTRRFILKVRDLLMRRFVRRRKTRK